MSEGILVLCEAVNGTIKKTAFELLGKATELAGGLGGSVTALLVGAGDASTLGQYGASKVLTVDADGRSVAVVTRSSKGAGRSFSGYRTGSSKCYWTRCIRSIVCTYEIWIGCRNHRDAD